LVCRQSMRGLARCAPALALAAIAVSVSGTAAALPLITLSGSARYLYGASLGSPDVTPYGSGLGLRAGVTLPLSLYLGASFDYFFGASKTLLADATQLKLSTSTTQVLANAGYDLGFGPLTLRPELGLGYSHASVSAGGVSDGTSHFVAAPGAELQLGFGLLNVGAEVRYNKVFSSAGSDADAFVFGVGVGISI
jgi:hypothetical protein